ncbi:MAG TPA: alpha/beta fold hydrolase [Candidatus Limnocylindrales bacterium]|nr:alpha/beta fold hydrolase [Candidatus Limnocylindrales bacterium]
MLKPLTLLALLFFCTTSLPAQTPHEGDFVISGFHFTDGETLPRLNLHYMTFGQPTRDAQGHVNNAVLIMHGTGGSSKQFLQPQFRDALLQPGQLLDPAKYFLILPDDIGHGGSTKPSDGLRAKFPHYGYSDMVTAEHRLVAEGLHVDRLRLVMGTSMGCMHSWMWGERYPEMMDALMPLACLPVPIAGRNRLWRDMLMNSIRNDPSWNNGDYKEQPYGLTEAIYFSLIAGSVPIVMQKDLPTAQLVDEYLAKQVEQRRKTTDANDLLYATASSIDYDPSKDLEKIQAPVMFINSADDFINPPELHIAEREIQRVKRGKFILIPASDQTHGHSTHTWGNIWKQYLQELLNESR